MNKEIIEKVLIKYESEVMNESDLREMLEEALSLKEKEIQKIGEEIEKGLYLVNTTDDKFLDVLYAQINERNSNKISKIINNSQQTKPLLSSDTSSADSFVEGRKNCWDKTAGTEPEENSCKEFVAPSGSDDICGPPMPKDIKGFCKKFAKRKYEFKQKKERKE